MLFCALWLTIWLIGSHWLGYPFQLSQVKISDEQNLFPSKGISMPFSVKEFMRTAMSKLFERSHLKYTMEHSVISIEPWYIEKKNPSTAVSKFEQLLQKLLHLHQQTTDECDDILLQYQAFTDLVTKYQNEFWNFRIWNDPMNLLYSHHLKSKHELRQSWELIKQLLIFSHGQYGVARGFQPIRKSKYKYSQAHPHYTQEGKWGNKWDWSSLLRIYMMIQDPTILQIFPD